MLSLLSIFFLTLSVKSQQINNIRYFDIDSKEISKSIFEEKRANHAVLDIPGDSVNHRKLIKREEQGKIGNRKELIALLENVSHKKIDTLQQIVIIYYPGPDPCNANGNTSFITSVYKEIEKGVRDIANAKTLYIYKDATGLEKYKNAIPWIKDPEQIVEKTFFKHPYPCSSFTVISKDGSYFSYFGEFYSGFVLEISKKMR